MLILSPPKAVSISNGMLTYILDIPPLASVNNNQPPSPDTASVTAAGTSLIIRLPVVPVTPVYVVDDVG